MRNRLISIATLALALGVAASGVLATACKSEEEKEAEKESAAAKSEATAAVSTAPVLDNKIASAVANAAKSQAQAQPGEGDGPPQSGILGPARANAELAPGEPPKLKLGSAGSEPRVALGAAEWGDKRLGQFELSIRKGNAGYPTTVFKLDGHKVATAAPAAPGAVAPPVSAGAGYAFDVVASELASNQPGDIPPDLAAEIRKFKGSQLVAQVSPSGLVGTPAFTLAKGAAPQLDDLLKASSATLNEAILPLPKEPVGVGGFWMTTSRETLMGVDVVVYRMVKVTEVNGDRVALDVNTKRYLAAETLALDGLEQTKVMQFQADSSTQMTLVGGSSLPLDGRSQTVLRAFVELEGQPRPIQLETRSLFAFAPVGVK